MLSGGTFPVLSKQKKGIYMSEKYKDTCLRPEERAKSLLEEMGLEEKMGQVNCVFPFDRVCFDYDYISEQTKYGIGEVSTLEMRRMETLEEAAAWQRKVQEIVMANSEHHIPAIFHMEGLCGAFIQDATSFPSGIGRASSFDAGLEEKIAEIVHRAGGILIVDGAHGAHFGFDPFFPESPVRQGADLVIQSLHKTLPALTQTALLHVNGTRVDRSVVREYERIYQTSSPSYLLMGSMDACVRLLEEGACWGGFAQRMARFYGKTEELKHLRLMNRDILEKGCMKAFDAGKLLISVKNTKITGNTLYKELLNRYYLQMEMACDTYVTAIVTPWDREEGLRRLADALLEIDKGLETQDCPQQPKPYPVLEMSVPLYRALTAEKHSCPLGMAAGKTAGTYVNLYPPGIPLVVPGEVITEEVIKLIETYVRQRLNVQGVETAETGAGLTGDCTITILN